MGKQRLYVTDAILNKTGTMIMPTLTNEVVLEISDGITRQEIEIVLSKTDLEYLLDYVKGE